jgi:hypothetical protein
VATTAPLALLDNETFLATTTNNVPVVTETATHPVPVEAVAVKVATDANAVPVAADAVGVNRADAPRAGHAARVPDGVLERRVEEATTPTMAVTTTPVWHRKAGDPVGEGHPAATVCRPPQSVKMQIQQQQ